MTAAPDAVPTPGVSEFVPGAEGLWTESDPDAFKRRLADLLARARAEERERIAVAIEAAKAGCVDRDRMTLDVAIRIARAEPATDAGQGGGS